jgi:hypothetical protein
MPVLDGRVTLALVDIRLTYFSAKVQGALKPRATYLQRALRPFSLGRGGV